MRFLLIFIAMVGFSGCSSCSCQKSGHDTTVGKYTTTIARINQKIDSHPRYNIDRRVEISIKGRRWLYNVPSSMDDYWWKEMKEGDTYQVLLEEKSDGKYIWSYSKPE